VDTTNIVSVINAPNPTILHSGINTLSTGSYSTYQWFKNGVIIAGATTSVYIYSTPGVYTVRVSDGNGCQATSAPYTVTDGGTSGIAETGITTVSVYPNPATSVLHIEASAIVHVMVMTADGRTLMHVNDAREINISDLASGMYMILIYDENNHLLKTEKLIKSE
jgi:hypothetical protein